jgi:hypothetical protein
VNTLVKQRIKISLIFDIIIFLILLLSFNIMFKNYISDNNIETLALSKVDLKTKNIYKISEIKDKYGIDIVYGQESQSLVDKVNAIIELDENIVYENLNYIYNSLNKYPKEYFKNKLTIVILKKFADNNIALASRNNLNEFKIYLSNNENYERSLNHELYHIFEYSNDEKFLNWSNLNPEYFDYLDDIDSLDNKYVYLNKPDNTYFVTRYSKTSEKEDRAEIFAEIMTNNNRPKFLDSSNIFKKYIYLKEGINKYFNNNNLHWNRW